MANKEQSGNNNNFKEYYKEDVKYYINNIDIDMDNLTDISILVKIFKGIFTKDEILTFKDNEIFQYINNKESILKLVYYVNSLGIEVQKQTETENQRELSINNNEITNIKIYNCDFIVPYYNTYIKKLEENYSNMVLKYDEDIDYLPTILSFYNI